MIRRKNFTASIFNIASIVAPAIALMATSSIAYAQGTPVTLRDSFPIGKAGGILCQVQDRSLPPSELTGYTISLSNFGMFAGRYATPVVVPPCVAIVAAGRARHQITPVIGGFESHKIIPLSITFDHRACTGGEAARFLRAMLDDLALAN